MTRSWRWLVVLAGVAVLVAVPFAVRRIPVAGSSISAADLLHRIQSSADVRYSGFAESTGGLALPVSNRFNSLNELFGATTQLRVWWRGSHDWRVDAVTPAGETDLHGDRAGTWVWDYESNTAVRALTDTPLLLPAPRPAGPNDARPAAGSAPIIRLPRSDDLVPANLARRLLSQATPGEVTRLPDARVAGHSAAGLRLRPGDKRSTIDHVDVWALPGNGLPLRVAVYGGSASAAFDSTLLDLSLSRPPRADTAFRPVAGADVRSGQGADIVATIDRFGHGAPPPRLAGLARQPLDLGAVGVYGRGVTMVVAVPLPSQLAGSMADALTGTTGSIAGRSAVSIGIGPVQLLLSEPGVDDARWLLVGTVKAATLSAAAAELPPAVGFHR
jgi:hypothetical protein